MKILMLCMLLIIASQQNALSKDFGVVGHVWDIAEEDILEYIEKKLRAVDVEKLKEEMRDKTRKAVERPKQVSGIVDNSLLRVHYHDPSYVVPEDVYDHKGNLLYKAGYKVNPLNRVPLRERLIFINGDNAEQVKYALQKRKEYQGLAKIILINGAPLEIQRKEKVWMYFDQQGVLTTKLGIKAVPALVEQSVLRLKVTEVSKEEWGEK
jgi:conjugal transfer pilus assembly protein TraW